MPVEEKQARREAFLARCQKFADAYVLSFDASAAARITFPNQTEGAARVTGYKMIRKPVVGAMIRELRLAMSQKTQLTAEWLEKRAMEGLAASEPGTMQHARFVELLGKRLPEFFSPDRIDVSEMKPEEREKLRAKIIADALAKKAAEK